MRIIYSFFYITIIFSNVDVLEDSFYCYYHPDKDHIYQPQLSLDNSFISSVDLAWEGGDDYGKVVFFKHRDSSNKPISLKKMDASLGSLLPFPVSNIKWSFKDPLSFYAESNKYNEKSKKTILKFELEFDDLYEELEVDEDITMDRNILKKEFNSSRWVENLSYYRVFDNRFSNSDAIIMVASNDFNDYRNIQYNLLGESKVICSLNDCDTDLDKRFPYPQNIQLYQSSDKDYYDIMYQHNNDSNRRGEDIYYSKVDMTTLEGFDPINIYPSIAALELNQISPLFNHNGRMISFLSQAPGKKTYDLYILEIDSYDSNDNIIDALSFYSDGDELEVFINKNIKKIDHSIPVGSSFGQHNSAYTNYIWHPEKNILFYIKQIKESGSEVTDEIIYYYDLEDDTRGKVETKTTNNSNLSLSFDGDFLLFNYQDIKDDIKEINCSDSENCCDSDEGTKIGIVELIVK